MPNILLGRIDNRLVHGQVGVTWTKTIGCNLIVVVDDDLVNDKLQQDLMAITADNAGVQIRFFTVQKTIDVIHKASDSQKIFIVTKTPHEMLKLIEGNVPITKVNVGNMHFTQGKKQLSKKVYVDEAELASLRKMKSLGVDIFIQDIPGDSRESIE